MIESGSLSALFSLHENRIYTMSKAFVKVLPSHLYSY